MANLLSNTTIGGYQSIHTGNIGSYAMSSSGGTLSGTLTIGTAGSTSQTRALRIVPTGSNPNSFGSYSGSWRSAIEIWDNQANTMLFLASPDGTNYNYSIIKSVGAGLAIDVGSAGGTNAIAISSAGVVNAPQGLQVGGNSVASQSWVQSQNYITNINQYYYVNPGAGNGIGFWTQAPTTYGITMAHTSAGYGSIYDNSEYYLYFTMTNGGNRGFIFRNDYGAIAQLASTGWLMTRGEIYPGYNNGGGAGQTSYYIYGNTNNAGLRTNGNWLVNGNLYIGARDVWFSDWFNQDLKTSASPTFSTVNLNTLNASDTNARYYYQSTNGVPSNNLGNPTVTEMALFHEQFNNKTAFYDPNSLSFWTSSDGVNFTEYTGFDTTTKKRFLGGDTDSGVVIPNLTNRFRIELENTAGYVFLNQLYMYWSSNSHSTRVHIWVRRCDNNQWYQWTSSDQYVSSWPGHLYLPFGGIPFYPGALASNGHYNRIRIEFIPSWSSGTYSTYPINLMRMQIWGGYPAGKRNIYSTDENQNVNFPAEVGSTSFYATNFRASNAYYLNGTSYYLNSYNGGIYTNARFESAGTIYASGGNSSNWNTAYGWGNHASAGYVTSSALGSYVPYGNWSQSTGLNDNKLYLRTNGDNNHYLWNASDDWEELNAYEGTGFRVTSVGGTVGLLYVHGSSNGGYTYSPYSFRAPIFYDSQDTGYYVDPNGTSVLNYLTLNASESMGVYGIRGKFTNEYIHLYNKVGVGSPNGWGQGEGNTPVYGLSTFGGLNVAYGYDGGATINTYTRINKNWGGGDYGAEAFTIRGTYPSITLRSTTHDSKWLIHHASNLQFYYGASADNNSWSNVFSITTNGNLYMAWAGTYISDLLDAKQNASTAINTSNIGSQSVSYATTAGSLSSMNISQFTNNSGYVTSSALSSYVPLSGTTLTEGNYFYFRSNMGAYLGATNSPSLQAFATGGNAAFMSFHRSGNYAVNFGLDSDNVMRIGGWSAAADRWVLDMNGNNTVAGSFRAPIFYDSQDTGYYLDPNSTSTLNGVGTHKIWNHDLGSTYYFGGGDWGLRHNTPYGWIQFGPANSSYAHIYTDRPTFYFNKDILINGYSVITTANIGSQSVTYATNSTRLYASDSPYTYGGGSPYYLYMNYDGGSYWELKVSPATPGSVRVAYSNVSGSANSVAWTNVSSRPTALSQFTNDLGNYGGWITSSGSISGNAATATNFDNGKVYSGTDFLQWRHTGGGVDLTILHSGVTGAFDFRTETKFRNQDGVEYIRMIDLDYWTAKMTFNVDMYNTNNGLGTDGGDTALAVDADWHAAAIRHSGIIQAVSDRREKHQILPITDAVTKVKGITGSTYYRDNNIHRFAGVIAQDVKEVLPEAVWGSEDTRYSVDYNALIALLIQATKEQQDTIDALTARIQALENK